MLRVIAGLKRSPTGRRLSKALIDATAVAAGIVAAGIGRFDFHASAIPWSGLVTVAALAAICQGLAGVAFGLYVGRCGYGTFDEIAVLARAVAFTTTFAIVVDVAAPGPRMAPLSVPVLGGVIGFLIMGAARFAHCLSVDRQERRPRSDSIPLLIFGAGDGGIEVIRAILRDQSATYDPVALLDDDPAKRNLRLMGVRVAGNRHRMAEVAARYEADTLLLAAPSMSGEVVAALSELANECGLRVMVLPPVSQLFGDIGVDDIRDIEISDLLGRHAIETDLHAIAGYLSGRRVLVTGAGGSIGSELCRQIKQLLPAALFMLDRDESSLHALQLSLDGHGLLDSPNLVLANIRDRDRLDRVFADCRPDVVFHAAALKHLPLLEQAPGEAVTSNVWGTLNVLQAAAAVDVERFVNISTDKAADPVSALGYSKRIAERLTAHMAAEATGTYVSVRFGNVLGSSGSVLSAFQTQVGLGGPITVTDAEVTRYFMTVEEAAQLVIQAAAIGRSGEALALDMGSPVKIADVARRLAESAPRPVDIVYTGLRPGEKLHEVLFGSNEEDVRPFHPLISHVVVPPIDAGLVSALDPCADAIEIRASLAALCRVGLSERTDLRSVGPHFGRELADTREAFGSTLSSDRRTDRGSGGYELNERLNNSLDSPRRRSL